MCDPQKIQLIQWRHPKIFLLGGGHEREHSEHESASHVVGISFGLCIHGSSSHTTVSSSSSSSPFVAAGGCGFCRYLICPDLRHVVAVVVVVVHQTTCDSDRNMPPWWNNTNASIPQTTLHSKRCSIKKLSRNHMDGLDLSSFFMERV